MSSWMADNVQYMGYTAGEFAYQITANIVPNTFTLVGEWFRPSLEDNIPIRVLEVALSGINIEDSAYEKAEEFKAKYFVQLESELSYNRNRVNDLLLDPNTGIIAQWRLQRTTEWAREFYRTLQERNKTLLEMDVNLTATLQTFIEGQQNRTRQELERLNTIVPRGTIAEATGIVTYRVGTDVEIDAVTKRVEETNYTGIPDYDGLIGERQRILEEREILKGEGAWFEKRLNPAIGEPTSISLLVSILSQISGASQLVVLSSSSDSHSNTEDSGLFQEILSEYLIKTQRTIPNLVERIAEIHARFIAQGFQQALEESSSASKSVIETIRSIPAHLTYTDAVQRGELIVSLMRKYGMSIKEPGVQAVLVECARLPCPLSKTKDAVYMIEQSGKIKRMKPSFFMKCIFVMIGFALAGSFTPSLFSSFIVGSTPERVAAAFRGQPLAQIQLQPLERKRRMRYIK